MAFWRRRKNIELEEEIQAHLRMAVQDRMERGETPASARLAALREFGNQTLVKEVTRATWGWTAIGRFLQDLRFAARMLRKNPGFAAVVAITLALGVGANTAIFSVVHAVLTPLPAPAAERVVAVWTENAPRQWHQFPASAPDFQDWRSSGVFSSLGCFTESGYSVRLGDRTERIEGGAADSGFFDVVGIQPELGRFFREEDTQPGHVPVILLSDGMWRSHFGADRGIIGRSVVVNGIPRTIVGVLPKAFAQFGAEGVYDPLIPKFNRAADRGSRNLFVMGRLRPGISFPEAQKAMTALSDRLAKQYPEDSNNTALLQPIEEAFIADAQALVLIMQGAVAFVLLIACANIANLLMARGTARAREMTVRAALGASRWQLSRQLLTESLLLALLGGVLAILPAYWGIRFIASFKLNELPDASLVTLNWSVLAFNFFLALATGLVFGLLPAWQACKARVSDALKAASRSVSGSTQQGLRNLLVVSEVALTLVLLVSAGLMLQSLLRLRSAPPGYNSHGVLTARVALAEGQYANPDKQVSFFSEAVSRLRTLTGVRQAAAVAGLPTGSDLDGAGLHFADRPEARVEDIPVVLRSAVTSGYFQTMQIPVVRGRGFAESDRKDTPLVAVVDEWTARRYWPNEDALGKRIKFGGDEPAREIVGVVGKVELSAALVAMFKGPSGQIYLPLAQYSKAEMSLVVRADGDASVLAPALRQVVRDLDIDQPVFQVETMDSARAAGRGTQELAAWLLGAFGLMALMLSAIGVYGVMAYSVGRRTHEFGIRLSLGARPVDVLKLVARQAVALNAIGIAVGLAGAFGLTRLLSTLLYGVGATDPGTFLAVTGFLAAVTLFAGYVPARRATRLDPVQALREE